MDAKAPPKMRCACTRACLDFFPNSPLAAEAMWRAADIRWQLAKADLVRSGKPPDEKYLQEISNEISAVEAGAACRL